jgi:hypothetical protein
MSRRIVALFPSQSRIFHRATAFFNSSLGPAMMDARMSGLARS